LTARTAGRLRAISNRDHRIEPAHPEPVTDR